MNQLPAYEKMIAEEIEGIEIPDMADAIWSRIEPVLDVEMPVADTPAIPPGKPFLKNPAVWMISACIIAIIIALFILSRNRRTAPPPQRDLQQHTEPAIKPDTVMKQDIKQPGRLKPAPVKNTGTTDEKHVIDSPAHSAFINEKKDSLLKTPADIKMPAAGMMKPSIEIKQPRKYGVEVSDSDYRFKTKPKE